MRKLAVVFLTVGFMTILSSKVAMADDYRVDEQNLVVGLDFLGFGVISKSEKYSSSSAMLPVGIHVSFCNINNGRLRLCSLGGALSKFHGLKYYHWEDAESYGDSVYGFAVTSPIRVKLANLGCSENHNHVHGEFGLIATPFFDVSSKKFGIVLGF